MSDGDEIRRAVLADPDDDTPRLVYADWLQEHGDAQAHSAGRAGSTGAEWAADRAEFIRAQIEAVRGEPFGVKARAAVRRYEELLQRHEAEWSAGVRDKVIGAWFDRGFVGGVSVEPGAFVRSADALFDAEPVQSLTFNIYDAPPHGQTVLTPVWELPRLRQLRRLALFMFERLADEEFAALEKCPHLAGLRVLSLENCPVPPAWARTMLGGDHLPALEALGLAGNSHLGPALAEGLPRARHRGLTRLDVSGVVFTSEQLQQVLQSRCLRRVEELRLGRGQSDAPGPLFHLELGWVLPWDRLMLLDLSGQQLGTECVRQIVRRPESAALRWLGLANNSLDAEAVRLLAGAKHLSLNYVDLRGNGFRPADLTPLRERFPEAVIEG